MRLPHTFLNGSGSFPGRGVRHRVQTFTQRGRFLLGQPSPVQERSGENTHGRPAQTLPRQSPAVHADHAVTSPPSRSEHERSAGEMGDLTRAGVPPSSRAWGGQKGRQPVMGQSRRTRGHRHAQAEGERQLWAAQSGRVGSGKDRTGMIRGHREHLPGTHTGNTGNRRDAAKPALVSARGFNKTARK